jgi:hypothetical protein
MTRALRGVAYLAAALTFVWGLGTALVTGPAQDTPLRQVAHAAKNPCNPCNPCAAKGKAKNPCNPCNPCAAKK